MPFGAPGARPVLPLAGSVMLSTSPTGWGREKQSPRGSRGGERANARPTSRLACAMLG